MEIIFLNILVQTLLDEEKPVINQERCFHRSATRKLLDKNDCNLCLEKCPRQAIQIDKEIKIKDSCLGCFICSSVCPREVFFSPGPRIKRILEEARKTPLLLSCARDEQNLGGCLAGFSISLFIAVACRQQEGDIYLDTVNCNDCEGDLELIEYNAKIAREMLSELEIPVKLKLLKNKSEINEKNKSKLTRKELLKDWYRSGKIFMNKSWQKFIESFKEQDNIADSYLMRNLLPAIAEADEIDLNRDFPLGGIKIDSQCTGCGECVTVCPTGALRENYDEGEYKLLFTSSLCINCGDCRLSCPHSAISDQNHLSLTDWMKEEKKLIYSLPLTECVVCGEEFIASRDEKQCLLCRKREKLREEVF